MRTEDLTTAGGLECQTQRGRRAACPENVFICVENAPLRCGIDLDTLQVSRLTLFLLSAKNT